MSLTPHVIGITNPPKDKDGLSFLAGASCRTNFSHTAMNYPCLFVSLTACSQSRLKVRHGFYSTRKPFCLPGSFLNSYPTPVHKEFELNCNWPIICVPSSHLFRLPFSHVLPRTWLIEARAFQRFCFQHSGHWWTQHTTTGPIAGHEKQDKM